MRAHCVRFSSQSVAKPVNMSDSLAVVNYRDGALTLANMAHPAHLSKAGYKVLAWVLLLSLLSLRAVHSHQNLFVAGF